LSVYTPTPVSKKKSKIQKVSILKVRPIDMAKQLTLIERDMFCKILPTDVIGGAWKKKDKAETSPNILKMIDWFNKVTSWVETEIVSVASVRDRTVVLSRFIQIAEHCIEMHNYSTGMGLVSALQAVERVAPRAHLARPVPKGTRELDPLTGDLLQRQQFLHLPPAAAPRARRTLPPLHWCLPPGSADGGGTTYDPSYYQDGEFSQDAPLCRDAQGGDICKAGYGKAIFIRGDATCA